MHSRIFRSRHALAVPLGLVLTASLALLPGASSALAQESPAAPGDGKLSYVVNTSTDSATLERVEAEIADADGTVVTTYEQIGVVIAHSSNPDFGEEMRAVDGVDSAGATRTAPLSTAATTDVGKPQYVKNPQALATELAKQERESAPAGKRTKTVENEPLESLQWNIPAIKADQAHAVSDGRRGVTVAVIDTGVDDTHPDLRSNFAPGQSANCVGGVPDTSWGAWRPYEVGGHYHGTHVAGIIAAPRNGIGIAGVAPGVKVASIKVAEQGSSLFFTEAVVCAFVFAAEHGIDVTNNSYYTDPWLYNCPGQEDQAAILEAVGRAAEYAEDNDVLNVASAGNSSQDLAADEVVDGSSPDDSTPVVRTIDPSECLDLPAQLPGVVTVSATGDQALKSYYSNYGERVIDVAAPGGDKYQIPDGDAKNGRVLSTMPDGDYAFLQGTSMAAPHVAGVAALVKSEHPRATPQEIQWRMKARADNPGCPTGPYDPDGDGEVDAECTGNDKINSFYGYGIVDALDAVRK